MQAVGDLARGLERARALHPAHLQRDPLLHRARGGEQARVLEEVALEVDLAVVEERAHHVHRLAQARERPALRPVEVVLLHHHEVAGRDDRLGAAAGQLVERRELLADQRRLAQEHVGHVRAEADVARLVGRRREQAPEILVPSLVDRVAGVVAELVGDLDHLDRVRQRIVGQHAVAEPQAVSVCHHWSLLWCGSGCPPPKPVSVYGPADSTSWAKRSCNVRGREAASDQPLLLAYSCPSCRRAGVFSFLIRGESTALCCARCPARGALGARRKESG